MVRGEEVMLDFYWSLGVTDLKIEIVFIDLIQIVSTNGPSFPARRDMATDGGPDNGPLNFEVKKMHNIAISHS